MVASLGALGASAAAVAAWRWRSEDDLDGHHSPVRHLSAKARRREVARVTSKTGGSYAVHRARRRFASEEKKRDLDRRFELKTADQVVETLGNMKGVLMKLGQMASFIDEGIPEAFRDALAQLQQDAPPMSPELAAQVMEEELGAAPDEVFAEWDEEPMAAASIGQVHRAVTAEGTPVAVKVQYPGVDDAMKGDLENVSVIYNAVSLIFRGLDPVPIVDELARRFTEELDYRTEAEHQRLFCTLYKAHPFIYIPPVVDRYSTARVLTTELADGARFGELGSWTQEERNLDAEAVYRFAFRRI